LEGAADAVSTKVGAGGTELERPGLGVLDCAVAVGWGGGVEAAVSAWGCKLATVALNTAAVADVPDACHGAGGICTVTAGCGSMNAASCVKALSIARAIARRGVAT
jgi:hypothetical protein